LTSPETPGFHGCRAGDDSLFFRALGDPSHSAGEIISLRGVGVGGFLCALEGEKGLSEGWGRTKELEILAFLGGRGGYSGRPVGPVPQGPFLALSVFSRTVLGH